MNSKELSIYLDPEDHTALLATLSEVSSLGLLQRQSKANLVANIVRGALTDKIFLLECLTRATKRSTHAKANEGATS